MHTRRAAVTYQVLVHHHHHCEHFFWKYLSPSIRHQVHADDAEKHFIIYLPSTDLIWSDDFHVAFASSPEQYSVKFARILFKNMHPQALPLSAVAICTMHHLKPRRLIHGYYIIEIEQNSYTFERRHRQTDRQTQTQREQNKSRRVWNVFSNLHRIAQCTIRILQQSDEDTPPSTGTYTNDT